MLLNYLKLATRLLLRSSFFTFLNVAGLGVGFAVFFLLWHHSTYELQSDQFHKDYQRIYRPYCDFRFAEGDYWNHYTFGTLPPILATLFAEKNREVEALTRLIHQKNFDAVRWKGPQSDTAGFSQLSKRVTLSYLHGKTERVSFKETRCAFADPNFFEFFSIPLIQGRVHQILNQSDAIALSESTARKYFGQAEPIGKTLIVNDKESFTVTGVFKDLGHNSHLNVDVLFSTLHISKAMDAVEPFQETAVNYFRFADDADLPKLATAFAEESELHWNFENSFPGSSYKIHFQPLKDAAFQIFENDAHSPKSKLKLQIFLVVGIVVLLMAWINYLNLKLSTQATRMKELATRKTAGAKIQDFIKQFLIESVLINILSVLVAFTIIQSLRSPLELYFQLFVPAWNEINIQTCLIFLSAMVIGILIAALHPALVLWKLTIRAMLTYGKVRTDERNFTKVTSVLQFTIAIILIVWLGTVISQVNFVLNNTWGLSRERVVVLELPTSDTNIGRNDDAEELKKALLEMTGIEDVTISTTVAGDLVRNRVGFYPVDNQTAHPIPKSDGGVDERFIPFYELNILAGRNFKRDHPADRKAVIISRAAAQSAGWEPEEALGKKVMVEKYPWRPLMSEGEIIGVIDDHRYSPLYLQTTLANANRGTILTYGNYLFPNNQPEKMSIRLKTSPDVLDAIQSRFEDIFPGKLFHWYPLDSHMNAHYQAEQIARNQIILFTSIAIGIACLGLLGVISNKAVSKTKEIGIRKVMGASLHQITRLLLLPTLLQIAIAIVIGMPLAYLLSQSYLQKFAERVDLQFWHFTLPILLMILIMLSSVLWVIWEAAKRNPVDALKHE